MTEPERERGTSLPPPDGWDAPPLRGWLLSIVASLLSLVMLVPSAAFATEGRPWAVVAVLAVIVLAGVAVRGRPVKPRFESAQLVQVEIDGSTTQGWRFPVRASSPLAGIAMLLAGVAFTGLSVAAAIVTLMQGDWPMLAGFAILGGVGAVFLLGGVAAVRSARSGLGIDLTPRHVIVRLGLGPAVLAWDDIDRVDATTVRYGLGRLFPRPIQHWLVLVRERHHAAAVPAKRLRSDPVVLYHALWHYLEHPDERTELGTDATLHRWNSADTY